MKPDKVIRRIAKVPEQPELLEHVARDIGAALADGQRAAIKQVAGELAARAPHRPRGANASDQEYWAGFAAAIGTMIAAHEAAFEQADARAAALGHANSETARAVIMTLATGPASGAEIAAQLGVTPGAASKVLAALRGAGIARMVGGYPYPKRGARKPHVLTPLGCWLADELATERGDKGASPLQALADVS